MGLMDKMKALAAEAKQKIDEQKEMAIAKAQTLGSIIVSTGDIPQTYKVIDAVFAMDSHQAGFLSSASPAKAFEGVKRQLREACLDLGGNAVINCQFEYRVAIGSGDKQCIEIFAYGTAVKLASEAPPQPPKIIEENVAADSNSGVAEMHPPQSPAATLSDIIFNCPKCSQNLKVEKSYAGQITNCPSCNSEIRIAARGGQLRPRGF